MEAGDLYPSRAQMKWGDKDTTRKMGFSTRKLEIPPLTIIHLTGQIDSSRRLESIIAVAISPETEHVAILMESVEYINSNGCGGLIALHHQVEKREFQMFIVGPAGRVARVMKRLGCYRILRVRQSLGEVITEVEPVPQPVEGLAEGSKHVRIHGE